jgi:hypothetical protein
MVEVDNTFKMHFWLHSHYETGEYLQFDLFSLEGFIHSTLISYIQDEKLMNEELSEWDLLDDKKYLEQSLQATCIWHYDLDEGNLTEWIELVSIEIEEIGEND